MFISRLGVVTYIISMADQDPPTQDQQDKPDAQEIIKNNDSNDSDVREEEEEENFIEDKEEEEGNPDDYKPKTFKRIKGLVEKLKGKDKELKEKNKELSKLKGLLDEYQNIDDETNDFEDDDDDDKPLTIKAAKLLIEKETRAEQINTGIKQALIELGFKTQAERAKYGKGLDKIALNIQQHRPDMSFKQAVKKAYEIKWEGVNKKEINDSVSGGSQNSYKTKSKTLSPLVLNILKSKGVSDDVINQYLKNN